MGKYALRVKNLCKSFGNDEVLKNINLDVKEGEIHGIVGANGSGKSTLFNILFGSKVISETGGYTGDIYLGDEKVNIKSVSDSQKKGIGMIHQEFVLFSDMTIWENISLNNEETTSRTRRIFGKEFSYIDKNKNKRNAIAVFKKLGLDMDVNIKVVDLSINMQQFVEIGREINKEDIKILLLDEPTAVLNKEDSEKLIKLLKNMAKKGISILFISHRLEEIVNLCDRVTVMKDGEIVNRYEREDFEIEKIAKDMIGHGVKKAKRSKKKPKDVKIMEFRNFSVDAPGEKLNNIDLAIYKGEILGLAGLSGHGKLAISYGIMGLHPSDGYFEVNGNEVSKRSPRELIKYGISYVPEDRRNMGLLLDQSIAENLTFSIIQNKNSFLKGIFNDSLKFIDDIKFKEYAEYAVDKYAIKCNSIHQKVRELSGGNQQKVCIGRILALEPEILFISEPTRGIDVAAKELILQIIVNLNNEKDTTIIIASSELEELKRICDRIAVFYEGNVFDILPADADDSQFALAFSGERRCAINGK